MIFFGTTQNPPWDRCTKTEARSPELKMFHAIMLVTREWCVEAETAEEALQLLAAGHGHTDVTWAIASTSKCIA